MSSIDNKPLADQAAREKAKHELQKNLAVEAGAGTGKTSLLVSRILNLVLHKTARLDRIAAITFTEKAAGELKARLRAEMEKLGGTEPDSQGRELWLQALRDLERASVGTIHAFAAGLLRERPMEAELDPNFEQLDTLGEKILFSEAWEAWLKEEMERAQPVLKQALALGIGSDRLFALARKLYDVRGGQEYREALFSEDLLTRVETAGRFFLSGADALLSLERYLQDPAGKDGRRLAILHRLRERLQVLPVKEWGGEFLYLDFTEFQSKREWEEDSYFREHKKALKEIKEVVAPIQPLLAADFSRAVEAWLSGFIRKLKDIKEEYSRLDFQDLLLRARNLVRSNKEVRAYFQNRYQYLLVDEFQDTDPLQVELVFFLAEEEARAEKWEEVKLKPGKLFIVGDPKQSIYRFRNADIEIYDAACRKLESSGERIDISVNFRTLPGIINEVNRVFRETIKPPEDGNYQPEYIPLKAERVKRTQNAEIMLISSQEEGSVDELRAKEAETIAVLIEQLKHEGYCLEDPESKELRELRYGDIALLLPTRNRQDLYEEALERRRIDFITSGGKEYYLRPEIQALIAAATAIDYPADELATATALISPLFCHSALDLLIHRAAGGSLNYLEEDAIPSQSPLKPSLELLSKLHRERYERPVYCTLEELLTATRILEWHSLKTSGRRAISNLTKLFDLARTLEKDQEKNWRGWVRFLQRLDVWEAEEEESPFAEGDEEAVSIMTVHQAKGLEFPVVILANWMSEIKTRDNFFLDRRSGKIDFRLIKSQKNLPIQTLDYEAAKAWDQKKEEAEKVRLAYVAATRARDLLVISAPLVPAQKEKLGQDVKLNSYLEYLRGFLTDENSPVIKQLKPRDLAEKPPAAILIPDMLDNNMEELVRRQEQERAEWLAQTAKIHQAALGDNLKHFKERPLETFTQKRKALRFGEAFHYVMERSDLKCMTPNPNLIAEAVREFDLSGEENQLTALAAKTLAHPLMERACRAERIFRELAFSLGEPGRIDLLMDEADGLVIVDFKTDMQPELYMEEYIIQLRRYRQALMAITQRPVKAFLLLVQEGKEILVDNETGIDN